MSSSMLEQAVIDAQELKEAAIKNAEQEVLDKYAGEIKEAVDALLEQEDPLADPMAVDPIADEGTTDKIVDQLPLKALEGQDTESSLAEGEKVEIDLDALEVALKEKKEPTFETSEKELHQMLENNDDVTDINEEELGHDEDT